ncbi:phage tail tip lysozyme [Pandoraea pnomenusa]|uniref:phage tail tip lysozyme n=1 Tax=Pandoraea pnomenusa TaxID=93220 RepID=UPI00333FEA11
MPNKIAIAITAKDEASGPIGKVRQSLDKLGKQAKSGKLDKLGDSIGTGLSSGRGAMSAVTRFVGGTGLVTGAVGALVLKLAQLESEWASSVRSMNNLGVRSGLSTSTAYGVQVAGRLAGLQAEQVNAGVEQVRQTYSDALNNRNPEALKRYQAAGISTDPGRVESIESVLTKLATYAETLRSQGKYGGATNFLGAAGASSLIDFLNRGPRQVAADLAAAKSYIPTDEDIERAREYADASAKLGITYDKLKTTIQGGLAPALNGMLSGLQFGLDVMSGRDRPKQAQQTETRIWDGMEKLGNFIRGRGAITMSEFQTNSSVGNGSQLEKARSMVEWYMNRGLSREQAIGMVANASRESSLDDRSVGDNGRAVGLYQWHPDRQQLYEKKFGRPLSQARPEEQMGFSLWELQNNEAVAGRALLSAKTSAEAAARISSLYERPKDPREAQVRADIARDLDSQLGQPTGEAGKMKIEIVHKNAPVGYSVNVSAPSTVETMVSTDRQQGALGDQYAYSPSNF